MPPLPEALVPDLTRAAPVKSPLSKGAPKAGANFGALQRPASVKSAVANSNPFDVFDAPTAANPFDIFDTPASSNPFDTFDGKVLATATENPAEHDPEGTALGRALKRGVLRTRSALPTLAAADATRLVHDATLSDNDILRGLVAQRLNVPALPDDVTFPDPVTAGQYLIDKGFPAHAADAVMTEFEVRMQHARPLRGDDAAIADTLARGGRGLLRAQELNDRAAAIPGSASAEEFKQVLAAAPDTTLDVLKAYAQNPGTALAFLGETAAESLPQMGASAVTTLATRSPAVGAVVLGGGTLAQEYGSGVNEFFREHGVAPQTPEEAAALLRNPELMADASNRGLGRGVIIALAEMAGQGVAAKQLFKGPVKEATKDVTAQMVAGGGGEAAARAATGQDMSPREIITEALAEGIATPVEVGATVYQSRKNAKAGDQPPLLLSGHTLSGERAGQLRTSDVQPLEASTKVPDTTRLVEPSQAADGAQADQPRYQPDGDFVVPEFNHFSDEADYQNSREAQITEAVDAALTPEVKAKALALHGGSEPWFQAGRNALIARLIARGGSLSKEVENFTTQRPGQRRQFTTQESLDIYAKARRVFSDRLADPQLSRNQRYELERKLELAEKMEAHVGKKMASALP